MGKVFFGGRGARAGSGVGIDDIFSQLFGAGGFSSRGTSHGFHNTPQTGQDVVLELALEPREFVEGGTKVISIQTAGSPERISVRIPPGMSPGKKIRVQGKGLVGPGGRGDLYLSLALSQGSGMRIEGENVEVEKPIPFSTACLGGTVVVDTIDGKPLKVKVPAGSNCGKRLRLRGKGLPRSGGGRGDMFVRLMIEAPSRLTKKQLELVKALRDQGL